MDATTLSPTAPDGGPVPSHAGTGARGLRPQPLAIRAAGYHRRVLAVADAGWRRLRVVSPLAQDAVLYLLATLFAAITAVVAKSTDYRQWGLMALVAYGVVAGGCSYAWWRHRRAPLAARTITVIRRGALVVLLAGAVLVPLGLELSWRAEGGPGQHAQPEVAVIERAGDRAARGVDPYLANPDQVGQPATSDSRHIDAQAFFPYLPAMVPFGLLNASTLPGPLRDARIVIAGFSLAVGVGALLASGASLGRGRAFQFLVVLPSGALPLVTGGDDLPVLALCLVALVLAQRQRPVLTGLVLGWAAALKFTAWPLVVLLAFAMRDRQGRRAPGRYALSVAGVALPIVAAGYLASPAAFVQNVIRFPLGLTQVRSPAASPLVGQVLVHALPPHKLLITAGLLVLGAFIVLATFARHCPRTPAQAARFAAFAMGVATVLAPATRFGYLIYPANLLIWAWVLDDMVPQLRHHGEPDQSGSLRSKTRRETVLVGATWEPPDSAGVIAGVLDSTRTPTSQ